MAEKMKLNPFAAIILMAIIIFVCNYIISTSIIYFVVQNGGYEMYMTIYPAMELLYWLVYPSIAALICVKVIVLKLFMKIKLRLTEK